MLRKLILGIMDVPLYKTSVCWNVLYSKQSKSRLFKANPNLFKSDLSYYEKASRPTFPSTMQLFKIISFSSLILSIITNVSASHSRRILIARDCDCNDCCCDDVNCDFNCNFCSDNTCACIFD